MSQLPIREPGQFSNSYTHPAMNGVPVPATDSDYLNPYKNQTQQKDELKHYLRVLYRRKWCVILPVLVLMPLVIILILLDDPSYRATSRILIKNTSDRVLDIQEVVPSEKNDAFYPTAYELLRSEENVSETLHTLGLIDVFPLETWNSIGTIKSRLRAIKKEVESLIITKKERTPLTPEEIAEIKRQEALSYFHGMLRVKPLEGNMLVDVSFEDPKPKRAALIVNTLIGIYVRNHRAEKLEAVTNATECTVQDKKSE